jgi:hypothetical protein
MKIGIDTNGLRIFQCPGCGFLHALDKRWTITGTDDAPTANPSVLNTQPWKKAGTRCHLFIRNGNIEYLNDCTHDLAGKTIPMEDWK